MLELRINLVSLSYISYTIILLLSYILSFIIITSVHHVPGTLRQIAPSSSVHITHIIIVDYIYIARKRSG